MVEAAETYVVSCSVACDNPLAALDDEVLEVEDAFADVAAASFAERHDCFEHFACRNGAFAVFKPFCSLCLDFVAALLACGCTLHEVDEAFLHLFVGDGHTESEFGKVLEQGVAPCGPVAAEVGGIGG